MLQEHITEQNVATLRRRKRLGPMRPVNKPSASAATAEAIAKVAGSTARAASNYANYKAREKAVPPKRLAALQANFNKYKDSLPNDVRKTKTDGQIYDDFVKNPETLAKLKEINPQGWRNVDQKTFQKNATALAMRGFDDSKYVKSQIQGTLEGKQISWVGSDGNLYTDYSVKDELKDKLGVRYNEAQVDAKINEAREEQLIDEAKTIPVGSNEDYIEKKLDAYKKALNNKEISKSLYNRLHRTTINAGRTEIKDRSNTSKAAQTMRADAATRNLRFGLDNDPKVTQSIFGRQAISLERKIRQGTENANIAIPKFLEKLETPGGDARTKQRIRQEARKLQDQTNVAAFGSKEVENVLNNALFNLPKTPNNSEGLVFGGAVVQSFRADPFYKMSAASNPEAEHRIISGVVEDVFQNHSSLQDYMNENGRVLGKVTTPRAFGDAVAKAGKGDKKPLETIQAKIEEYTRNQNFKSQNAREVEANQSEGSGEGRSSSLGGMVKGFFDKLLGR